MATITGLTKAAMQTIRDTMITGASLSGNDLVLTRYNGGQINVGNVRGPVGPASTPPLVVSSFPTSPSNGDEIYAQTANMKINQQQPFLLRFNNDGITGRKWEGVAGSILETLNPIGALTLTTTTLTSLTGGPTLTVPYTGLYKGLLQADTVTTGSGNVVNNVNLRAVTPNITILNARNICNGTYQGGTIFNIGPPVALTAGDVVSVQCQQDSTVATNYGNARIGLIPYAINS